MDTLSDEGDVLELPDHEAGCECASCMTKFKDSMAHGLGSALTYARRFELTKDPLSRNTADHRCRLDYFHCERDAVVYTGQLNKIVMGIYGGKSAHTRLFVACEGPSEGRWSVIEVEDAIEAGFYWKWTA